MKIHKLVLGLLLVPLLVFGNVAAQTETDPDTSTSDTDTTTTDRTDAAGNLETRLERRKARLEARLDEAQKLRLQAVCRGAQGKLKSVEARVKGIQTRRTTVYGNLLERLENLSTKLKAADVDTAEYDKQVAELSAMIAAFSEHLEGYTQAVSDMVAMDCEADPEAFHASLQAARDLRSDLIKEAQSIRKYLTGTIRETLTGIRQQLGNDSGEDS